MSGLSMSEREALTTAIIRDANDRPIGLDADVIDQIATARVKAALTEAADAIKARALPSPERGTPGRLERAVYADAARIVRAHSP